jgi:glycosyltransferase involved in cell wall biosynthesis
LGVDCDVYEPGDKYEARDELGIPPDCFLVTMVAANKSYPSRKSFPAALDAFAMFQQVHEEAKLYLHTEMVPKKEGVEIVPLIETLKIPERALIKPDFEGMLVGIPDEEMAKIYRASDVLLNPAMGEGFGLPIVEAQACGTPVITQNVTSMTELTFNGRLIGPVSRVWIPKLNYWQYQASPQRILDALEELYALNDDQREVAGARGAEMVRDRFDWGYVAEQYWKPFLERVEAELW